jgi:hypothetical protein
MIVHARGSRIRNAESRSWRVVARTGERILWIFREHAIVNISVSMVCIECENTCVVPRNQPSVVPSYSMCVIFIEKAHFDLVLKQCYGSNLFYPLRSTLRVPF